MTSPQVIIVGAGILGLASAYHILQSHRGLGLLMVERLARPGQGNTARSAAAFRDMFSSQINRNLSQGSIAFYENLAKASHSIGLKKIGYLWLATAGQMSRWEKALAEMAEAGVKFLTLDRADLAARLSEMRPRNLDRGIFGVNCGILESARLIRFYEQEVLKLGGRLRYRCEVTGFSWDGHGQINGVWVGEEEIPGGMVIVATGAWTRLTMGLAGLEVPLVPRKRQLFSIPAKEGPLHDLLSTSSLNDHNLLPFTILPGGGIPEALSLFFHPGIRQQGSTPRSGRTGGGPI